MDSEIVFGLKGFSSFNITSPLLHVAPIEDC